MPYLSGVELVRRMRAVDMQHLVDAGNAIESTWNSVKTGFKMLRCDDERV